jgi:hypothetical protein
MVTLDNKVTFPCAALYFWQTLIMEAVMETEDIQKQMKAVLEAQRKLIRSLSKLPTDSLTKYDIHVLVSRVIHKLESIQK